MMRWTALVILGMVAAAAEPPSDRPKLPPELDHVVQLANAAPPEFAADALLRVAAITTIDRRLRMELIDKAFHLAPGAQFHTPMTIVEQVPDTSAGMAGAAAKLYLDTLSLQCRAIYAMLQLDKPAARRLFLEMNQPSVDAPACDQPLVEDVAPLYEVLAAVANSTFTEQERKKEEHINLVMSNIARATSPLQITPLQRMVASLSITPEQREMLATRVNALKFTEAKCAPQNAFEVSSRPDAFWKSDQAKRLFDRGVRLRFKDNGTMYSEAERNTPEWSQQLTDYMKDLGEWKPSDEKDESSYYHQKAIIYEMLVELTPRGPERDHAIQSFVEFVSGSNLQREKPVEWFFHAQSLLNRVRSQSNGEPAKVAAAFIESGNPVLVLYMELDRLKL